MSNPVFRSGLPSSRVDTADFQRLKIIIDCPQPGSSQATYWSPPLSRWSKCGVNIESLFCVYLLFCYLVVNEDEYIFYSIHQTRVNSHVTFRHITMYQLLR